MTEADVCRNFVLPSIYKAGFDNSKIKEQFSFTDGRIEVFKNTSRRREGKRADYLLFYKSHLPLAVIEAKDDNHTHFDGISQAVQYAQILDIPFAYSTNGKKYLEHDLTTGLQTELEMADLPSPENLYQRWVNYKGYNEIGQKIVTQDYYRSLTTSEPRYYQRNAINRTVEAVIKGQNRILLVMATGTGKTATAFQIIHKLWKTGLKKRILFLADRNILIDQTIGKDFAPLSDKMVKITGKSEINKLKSYEVFLSLYQALIGKDYAENEDVQPDASEFITTDLYKQFGPDFFDLIIIDECHRGSAKADSSWREILDYFNKATQIGMTATPKNTLEADNFSYFGEPVYTYSLKQGIEDGFLAPYKVINYTLNIDAEGYRPDKGKVDKYGNLVEDRIYNTSDFDRNIVISERAKLIALELTKFLKSTDRYAKTIIFCENTEHAALMRQYLLNENSDINNPKYAVRITGNEHKSDLQENLYDFINPYKQLPVIATTSKLLTTGVDTKTVKVIVLDTTINSLSEFKQIIGRGTRIQEDEGKTFFTIIDFRKATNLFADPDFDGQPVQVFEVKQGEDITLEDIENLTDEIENGHKIDWEKEFEQTEKPVKYYVDGVDVSVLSRRTQVMDEQGKLVNLELTARKEIQNTFKSLNNFIADWNKEDKKTLIIQQLRQKGVFLHEIYEEYVKKHKSDIDLFDLIAYVAFDKPALSRKERANNVKKRDIFGKYSESARMVLLALLDKYGDKGIEEIEDFTTLSLPPLDKIGAPLEIINPFGGPDGYKIALKELEMEIYRG